MAGEIVNKVAQSGLINFDLSEVYPKCERVELDIKDQLWQGIALKEKEFRSYVNTTDWSVYKDKAVAIFCSADAIIPSWAFMLLAVALQPHVTYLAFGNRADLEKVICVDTIQKMNMADLLDARVIIKGCADIPNPTFALTEITKKLTPVVKSLMFGEACSTVPLFKKK